MATVSANLIHHQQQSGHPKVANDDQSEEESNDGSVHSITRDKHSSLSSPEYKPSVPDSGTTNSCNGQLSENTHLYSPNQNCMRSPKLCEDQPDIKNIQSQFHSPFSMQNVLKMKNERESVSPPSISSSNSGVFSTEKLLENTPSYSKSVRRDSVHGNDDSKIASEEEMDYRDPEYSVRSSSPIDDEEKSNRLESSGINEEDNSCCSEDTVLSVGNEVQTNGIDIENRTCSTTNSTAISPRSSTTPSSTSSTAGNIQSLSSFKHIQSHLSAISQLSQNLHGGQHMLLRPSPITPNPLMFLNQNRLLFNPHLAIPGNVSQMDVMQSPQSISSSPTSINPALSRLSPNELSPTTSVHSQQMSPSPPGFDGKMIVPQNIPVFGSVPSQMSQSLRFYKQNVYPSAGMAHGHSNLQNIGNSSISKKLMQEEKSENRKMFMKSFNQEKVNLMSNSSHLYNHNERLYSNNNVLLNNPNITNNNADLEDRHNLIINHNGLKFSIDNILKADFGRRITDPLHKRKSGSSKHKFGAGALNALNSAGRNPIPSKQDIKEAFENSAYQKSAFQPSKEIESFYSQSKACSLLPNSSLNSSSSSSASSRLSSERLSTETRTPSSSDLKPLSSLQNNSVSSSVGGTILTEKSATGSTNPIDLSKQDAEQPAKGDGSMVWPAWVYCTRYSDRPSSGPRTRRPKKQEGVSREEEKRPRTAFSGPQLARLKHEFAENRYLTERRRQQLSAELGLNEAQIKIWFQNKRAKIKKASGQKNPLALQLMAQGLYNHSTVPLTKEEEELQQLHERETRDANA